jgi:hypothetical protein
VFSLFPGNNDGTFGAAIVFGSGGSPYSITSGDFNRDGAPDLAIVDGDNLRVFLNMTVSDVTPDTFTFNDQTGAGLNLMVISNSITVTGINGQADVSITAGGEYEINGGGTWTSAAGTVSNMDTVRVRQTSSMNPSTTTDVTLTIGGASDTFSVTTRSRISLQAGTTGTEIELADVNLGNRKGVMALRAEGKTYKLKILSWNENGSGVVRAVVNKVLPPGLYDVIAQPKEPKDASPVIATGAFTVAGPDIQGISSSNGTSGDSVTISGVLFGTKKPKVYLEYITGTYTKRKSCKVLSWPFTSDTGTGSGEVAITIPKGIPEGPWVLAVENGVGRETIDFEYIEIE